MKPSLPRILFLALMLPPLVAASAQPIISVKDTLIEFGDVYKGAKPRREIRVFNNGTAPLLIEHVDSPCSCTTTALQSNIVGPNDSTGLIIQFNSADFNGPTKRSV